MQDASAGYLEYGQKHAGYLESLDNKRTSKYTDDAGFTFNTPLRYSVNDWWRHILSFPDSTVLRRVRSHLLFNFAWSVALSTASLSFPQWHLPVPHLYMKFNLHIPFQMSGGILGILLAFRTGQSYDRFWHGRMAWTKVINKVRSIGRTLFYLDSSLTETTAAQFRWLKVFPVCLMQHLRGERDTAALAGTLLPNELRLVEAADSMPLACTLAMTQLINLIKQPKSGQEAAGLVWWQLEFCLMELSDAIGEAEALAGTPVPITYSRHASRLLSLWTLTMPFVLLQHLPPLLVPIVTVFVSWMLLATEEIGHLIEEPFGLHNDRPQILPLERYCDLVASDLENMDMMRAELQAYGAAINPIRT